MSFDITSLLAPGAPAPAAPGTGLAEYHFIGGNNDDASIPTEALAEAARAVLAREGQNLAMYNLGGSSLGYAPLREFIAASLKRRTEIDVGIDNILIASGSSQALELVNDLLLAPGDTVIAEEASYASALSRIRARGVSLLGAPLDDDGIVPEKLAAMLADLKGKGVRPKFVYTIPTVQNPTGTIMSRERRLEILKIAAEYDVLIFEDDCYADLTWDGERPPAFYALDDDARVLYCGSFSKTLAPALRIGYMVADQSVIHRLLPLKRDAGCGAVEQMMLAEFAKTGLDPHITALTATFQGKCEAMSAALAEQFGAVAEFDAPKGGIFTWITLPETVDTTKLAQIAAGEGVMINPGADWSADPETGRHQFRLCFGHPTHEQIRGGVAKLAEICHREFGIPLRSGNVERPSD